MGIAAGFWRSHFTLINLLVAVTFGHIAVL